LVNYDLQLIEFLKSLDAEGIESEYEALRSALGRRPTLLEFYRGGASLRQLRQRFGSWVGFIQERGDLERDLPTGQEEFLRELETTAMTKSYKMVLLEAFQELDGWREAPTLERLAARSWEVLQRRRPLLADLPEEMSRAEQAPGADWERYWRSNPVNAWVGGNTRNSSASFRIEDGRLVSSLGVTEAQEELFAALVQEVVDYRFARYAERQSASEDNAKVVPITKARREMIEVPFFPNLRIACGHFAAGRDDVREYRRLGPEYGRLDPARHFVVKASGNSMNGGKNPIRDGDFLLMEWITPTSAGSITGNVIAIERQDVAGDDQYLLRNVVKGSAGEYILRAYNAEYDDLIATEELRTRARLRAVVPGIEMMLGQAVPREDIPALFGGEFNPGNWNSGQVVLSQKSAHVLLVTLSKRGRAISHRYVDHWIDDRTFHWQSQNQTSPTDKRGREIIQHKQLGLTIHLFVREEKLAGGKSAPFVYFGPVEYRSHSGSRPMSVTFELRYPNE
jgi:phage repressor protein C with HTH and peptisase S24 domain